MCAEDKSYPGELENGSPGIKITKNPKIQKKKKSKKF
jgi:hypothetical protein